MTTEEKNRQYNEVLELLESINDAIDHSTTCLNYEFSTLTPIHWEAVEATLELDRAILESIRDAMKEHSAKVIENEALNAHLTAVILAPE